MKDATASYISAETATVRKPDEIYHIYDNSAAHYRYTTCDASVVYDSESYTPKPITRGTIKLDEKLGVQTIKVKIPYNEEPVDDFISQNPGKIYWIDIMKIHRDASPITANVIFTGMFRNVIFGGNVANIECASIEQFFKKKIPAYRYQKRCNRVLYSTGCGVTKASYKQTTTVTVTNNGKTLYSTDFGAQEDGYFNRGFLESSGKASVRITGHSGNYIHLFWSNGLSDGDSVDVYPGCDLKAATCRDKFSNLDNFLGFPYIPYENPVLRTF